MNKPSRHVRVHGKREVSKSIRITKMEARIAKREASG